MLQVRRPVRRDPLKPEPRYYFSEEHQRYVRLCLSEAAGADVLARGLDAVAADAMCDLAMLPYLTEAPAAAKLGPAPSRANKEFIPGWKAEKLAAMDPAEAAAEKERFLAKWGQSGKAPVTVMRAKGFSTEVTAAARQAFAASPQQTNKDSW